MNITLFHYFHNDDYIDTKIDLALNSRYHSIFSLYIYIYIYIIYGDFQLAEPELLLLVTDEILKYFLVLIPALDSCKSQLLFPRRVNVDFLFGSRRCRHVLRPLPHTAFPVAVISIRNLSAFIPLKSDTKTIFISPVHPSHETLRYRY